MAPESEAAMQHRTLPSQDFPGEFSMPFPGPQPNINQRRTYMRAFCQWHYMRQNFESRERHERHSAQLHVAESLIEDGIPACRVSIFEWYVDQVFWLFWFDGLPDDELPRWPWPDPPTPKEGEGRSWTYECLKEEHQRKGYLTPADDDPNESEKIMSETALVADDTDVPPDV
ncbi:hypothetical protein FSARC_7913 [Fusarium sarcochroum]|uniref:Uncharacterized protein n=1 Tax=Fusarium sarcochroum TaxID=1208366 RepID=A0A8H4TU08_9HYPO|nr:hypothetical protein FSARC_7913 [Fusarium sarcochroum]